MLLLKMVKHSGIEIIPCFSFKIKTEIIKVFFLRVF